MLSSEVAEELQYYVYRLIDPRNGETFYIGKGIGNRVFAHVKGELGADDALSDKLQRIREIRVAGFETAHVIHRHGMNEQTAFEVEAALIEAYPEVTNIVGGHGSDDRGVMHSKQIIEKYQAEEIEFHHKVLLINISQTATDYDSIYEAVRYAWRISPEKARKANYVLAVRNAIVVGVFVAHEWLEATAANFPKRGDFDGRWGFVGEQAPDEIVNLYLRKRVPDSFRKQGSANPVRYVL